MKVLSMGAGRQTVALWIRFDPIIHFDYVLFGNTGDEMPETYEYIETYLKPAIGDRWIDVRNPRYDSIYEQCVDRHIAPDKMTRWCTADYKVRPIKRKLRELGATKKNPAHVYIGFSIDEIHRFNPNKPHPQYIKYEYPLLDERISLEQCKRIILEHGWPLPVKSGCYHCPFQTRRKVRALKVEHPDLFERLIQIERGVKDKMKHPYMHERALSGIDDSGTLDTYFEGEGTCDEGHCML